MFVKTIRRKAIALLFFFLRGSGATHRNHQIIGNVYCYIFCSSINSILIIWNALCFAGKMAPSTVRWPCVLCVTPPPPLMRKWIPPAMLLAGLNSVMMKVGLWLECAMWQSNACDKSVFKDEKWETEMVLGHSVVPPRAPVIKSTDLMSMRVLWSHSVNTFSRLGGFRCDSTRPSRHVFCATYASGCDWLFITKRK